MVASTRGRRVAKARVVRVKGKDAILEGLKGLLSGFEYRIGYSEVEGGEEGVLYKYEELHAAGYVDNVYVAVTCDPSGCRVEAPVYSFLVEPCYSKPAPAEVVKCVRTVVEGTRKVEGLAGELQAMVLELSEHGFEIRKILGGAEAYWSKVGEGTRGHIRVHLSPRGSILQLQVEGEPAKIVGIARVLTKLAR